MTRLIRLNLLLTLMLAMPFILATPLLAKAAPWVADPDAKQGMAQWKAGDLDAAIASFTKVIKKFPNHPSPLVRRGMVYHDNNDLDNAIADFTKVKGIRESISIKALYLRARCYYERGDFDKALDDAKSAFSQSTDVSDDKKERAEALVIGGMVYYERDQFDKALTFLDRALKVNPKNIAGSAHSGAHPLRTRRGRESNRGLYRRVGNRSEKCRSIAVPWPCLL